MIKVSERLKRTHNGERLHKAMTPDEYREFKTVRRLQVIGSRKVF